ncbi:helix-turn-helix transcriptional regulator [Massilia rhizosphaerae]|uniref:helix-turn-helix transcriptional regulator n=1 Tax=Massilia rhizosphaerae TaxID=2784389 RepID=UPI0018DB019E|nr:AlpA family transcriptional regulator [Massilia rhizosphaerae]
MNAPKRFLRLPAVIERVGKSRTAIYRDIQGGTFPAPLRIGARSVAWDSDAIAEWQQKQINAAGQGNTQSNDTRA